MKIKTFIEKAIKGGWNKDYKLVYAGEFEDVLLAHKTHKARSIAKIVSEILLDPLAWQAVGKVEGWSEGEENCRGSRECVKGKHELHNPCIWEIVEPDWKKEMHNMIGALIEGKTIEEFIETL